MSTCRISEQYGWIKCQNPVLNSDPEGLCLLHSRQPDKDAGGGFSAAIQAKLDREDYDFQGVFFPGPVSFAGNKFKKHAKFAWATFSGEAVFSGATFSDGADFWKVTFSGKAVFFGATFSGEAVFLWATFSGEAAFRGATFSGRANFFNATFSGEARFNGLHIEKEGRLRFQDLSLAQVLFAGTDLRDLEFHNVTWNRYWWRDAVYDEVILDKKEMARISQVIKKSAYLADVIPWNTEKEEEPEEIDPREYARVEELYRYLKINYEREGDHKKAGDFHYGEMEMHRLASKWGWCPVYWYNLYRVLSGYGERPVRALIWLVAFLLGLSGLVRGLGLKILKTAEMAGFWEAFIYILQKATLQRPDWAEPVTLGGLFLSSISVLLLPGQGALFILALRNRLGRRR